ncbi:twinfilin [Adelges cooleyi]|uniref:twinfilin n=1 Tax=Adelges cooleyi TaxID=133065 RepID=UPI00217FF1FA|nr:twinfilin [Adelges cooleyi]XP_050430328.1 twinfilin [Adelges cooleyi]
MSHQTGIKANDVLKKFFSKSASDKSIRAIKVSIEDEQLVLSAYEKHHKSWKDDFENVIKQFVYRETPCYILYRFDVKSDTKNYDWLLISWCPDVAPIRQKMLYASTKATLKQEFGSAKIKEELHGTILSDVTLDGLEQSRISQKAPAPLTMREEEIAELRRAEVGHSTSVSVDSRAQTMSGVKFPMSVAAVTALSKFVDTSEVNYVQFYIDINKESIELAKSDNVPISKLNDQVPKDDARYHLYAYQHNKNGTPTNSIFFIYSMPGYSCPIKVRMLYSSCKSQFIEELENIYKLQIHKKLEIDNDDVVNEHYLLDELYPEKESDKPKFSKPKAPGRGARRITKSNE